MRPAPHAVNMATIAAVLQNGENRMAKQGVDDRKARNRRPPKAKTPAPDQPPPAAEKPVKETGGRDGPDPTRYGDWEKNGRCVDF